MMQHCLFKGGSIDIASDGAGRILAAGPGAREAAGVGARQVDVRGEVLPGLHDAHIHLGGLAEARLGVDLEGSTSRQQVLARIRDHVTALPANRWVLGRGWYNDAWQDDARFPSRRELDEAAGRRPALLFRKDGHSAWASSAALAVAGVGSATPDPDGGVIDRDGDGEPTGILREAAMALVERAVPRPGEAELDGAMRATLTDLVRKGITSVHSMDQVEHFASLQRLHRAGELPLRVSYNIPVRELEAAERLQLQSGLGDAWLRIWGVKAFLDGSLGSRTAHMLDGTGVALYEPGELAEIARRCARARLNVCWHAIGDAAVRRALDALQPLAGAWPGWRPRIEHAQSVQQDDWDRFKEAGVIASMQPVHAVADRELADREWPEVTPYAYAWRALESAGAVLAFGSDAPVETADPLAGIAAATTWRETAGWYPELAISRQSAIRAYTGGAAFAAGMERELGALVPGQWCDLTVVNEGRATATVVAGQVLWQAE